VTWAVSLPLTAADGLGPLRFLAGAEACREVDTIWLRGAALNEADELRLRQLPGAKRFNVNPQGEVVPIDSLLPTGVLPTAGWTKLDRFLEPVLPELRIVSGSLFKLPLSLVRDTQEREVSALLTSFDEWRTFVLTAPQVRLMPLKFAATNHVGLTRGRSPMALVIGTPLPPLRGERFYACDGIFIAAGWQWSPAVDAQTLRRALGLQTGDLALWHANGTWELLRTSDLAPARRSAVRATAEGLADVGR
jgi:hypothetical protein